MINRTELQLLNLPFAWQHYYDYFVEKYGEEKILCRWNKFVDGFNILYYGSYDKFQQSFYWREKKNEKFKSLPNNGYCCGTCKTRKNLELHHIGYSVWGMEDLDDLVYLCRECHQAEHDSQDLQKQFDKLKEGND